MFYNNLPEMILQWQFTREIFTKRGTPERTKMRIMEKYALMIVQGTEQTRTPNDSHMFNKATEIFSRERLAPQEQQIVGNFLEALLNEATAYISNHGLSVAPTDKVEDIFKYLTGTEENVEQKVASEGCSALFSSMLDKTYTYCRAQGIVLFGSTQSVTWASSVNRVTQTYQSTSGVTLGGEMRSEVTSAVTAAERRQLFLARFDQQRAASATGNTASGTILMGDVASNTTYADNFTEDSEDLEASTDYPKKKLTGGS